MTDRYPVFTAWMKQQGFTPEHKFHSTRMWRMDYAHLGFLIYLEVGYNCKHVLQTKWQN